MGSSAGTNPPGKYTDLDVGRLQHVPSTRMDERGVDFTAGGRAHFSRMTTVQASFRFLLVNALAAVSVALGAQPQPAGQEPCVSGYVLAPDGTPVSGGTVVARSGSVTTTQSIDRAGRFRLVPARSGPHEFLVNVPGYVAYRLAITVPQSRCLRLPVIRLAAGAYFRVRLVSAAGEPIVAPR